MTRSDLFAIAKAAGWKQGKPLTQPVRAAIDTAVRAALATSAGARSLSIAPNVASDSGLRPMTADDAVRLLMEELGP